MKCCICGKQCENEWGNNPYPVNKNESARCCNECNDKFVIPARIKIYFEAKNMKGDKKDD